MAKRKDVGAAPRRAGGGPGGTTPRGAAATWAGGGGRGGSGGLRALLSDPVRAIALAFGLTWLVVALFLRPIGDFGVETDFYGELATAARQWLGGHGGLGTGFRGPLYPLLLGIVSLPLRDMFLVGKLLSVIGATLALGLSGSLVRRLFGPVAGVVASLALAANATFTDYTYRACTDMVYGALFAAVLWWLLREDDESPRRWLWAGALAGAAWLTRYNGAVLLPAGLLAAALGGGGARRAARNAGLFAGAMAAVGAPWALYVMSQTGDPFWSANHQNVALEVLGRGAALAQAADFMSATDFRSTAEVYATWPAQFRQVMLGNLAGHARQDLLLLATLPWGVAALLGWAAGFRRWANRRGVLFLLIGALTYLSLVPIYYNPRYMLTLLLWWAAGVGLLAEAPVALAAPPAGAAARAGMKGARRPVGAAPFGAAARGVIALVAVAALALTGVAVRRAQDPAQNGGLARELLEVTRQARRSGFHFDDSTPIAARRPHVGFYLGAPTVPVPAGTLDDLRRAGIHYLLVSGSEVATTPALRRLWAPAAGAPLPAGLSLVAKAVVGAGGQSYAATLYALDNAAPWRHAIASPFRPARPDEPGLDRTDSLRLRLLRWYVRANADVDVEAFVAQMSAGARATPEVARLCGDAALRRNDAAGAARHYQRALELRPADPAAALGLAALATLGKDRAEQRHWLSVALAGPAAGAGGPGGAAGTPAAGAPDPTGLDARPDWGGTPAPTYRAIQVAAETHLQAQEFAQAVAPYATILEIDPTSHGAWINLAYALRGIGQEAAAQSLMREALTRFPDDPEAQAFLRPAAGAGS